MSLKHLLLAGLMCTLFSAGAQASDLIVIDSKYIHQDDSVLVFSPVSGGFSIPTLFLLHGRGGNYRSWDKHCDMQALADRTGWRIICPDGQKKGWYVNAVETKWRDFFWQELWPLLSDRYGLDRTRTFISGLSMGGHGAINLFLDHPEMFVAAGTMSGALDLTWHTSSALKEVPALLGDTAEGYPKLAAESAINRILEADDEAMKDKLIVISCGISDALCPVSRTLEERCHEKKITCIAFYTPGKHSWDVWDWSVRYHVDFFRQQMEKVAAASK